MKDKIVLVLRYFPEDAEPKTKAILSRYADLRYKALAARQRGAKAMLMVTGPRSPNAGETIPMSFDTAIAGSGIVALTITGDMANTLFQESLPDKTLADVAEGAKSMDCGTSGSVTSIAIQCEHHAERRAQQRQHDRFRQQLTHNPPASSAEGHADGQFAAARGEARHLQVCDVDAGDQEHERDGP